MTTLILCMAITAFIMIYAVVIINILLTRYKRNDNNNAHFLIQQIKGVSSRILRNEFKELKRKMPSMWTRSYFIESVGHISQETIEKYIQEQKNK